MSCGDPEQSSKNNKRHVKFIMLRRISFQEKTLKHAQQCGHIAIGKHKPVCNRICEKTNMKCKRSTCQLHSDLETNQNEPKTLKVHVLGSLSEYFRKNLKLSLMQKLTNCSRYNYMQ